MGCYGWRFFYHLSFTMYNLSQWNDYITEYVSITCLYMQFFTLLIKSRNWLDITHEKGEKRLCWHLLSQLLFEVYYKMHHVVNVYNNRRLKKKYWIIIIMNPEEQILIVIIYDCLYNKQSLPVENEILNIRIRNRDIFASKEDYFIFLCYLILLNTYNRTFGLTLLKM